MGIYAWGCHGSRGRMGNVMGRRPSGYMQGVEAGGGEEKERRWEHHLKSNNPSLTRWGKNMIFTFFVRFPACEVGCLTSSRIF